MAISKTDSFTMTMISLVLKIIYGAGYMIALTESWEANHRALLAIFHGLLSWIYVLWLH